MNKYISIVSLALVINSAYADGVAVGSINNDTVHGVAVRGFGDGGLGIRNPVDLLPPHLPTVSTQTQAIHSSQTASSVPVINDSMVWGSTRQHNDNAKTYKLHANNGDAVIHAQVSKVQLGKKLVTVVDPDGDGLISYAVPDMPAGVITITQQDKANIQNNVINSCDIAGKCK